MESPWFPHGCGSIFHSRGFSTAVPSTYPSTVASPKWLAEIPEVLLEVFRGKIIETMWEQWLRSTPVDDWLGDDTTWWFIPLSKWVVTPVISGLTPLIKFITRVITHLLSGMNHQVPFICWDYFIIQVAAESRGLTQPGSTRNDVFRDFVATAHVFPQMERRPRCLRNWIGLHYWLWTGVESDPLNLGGSH